VDCAGVRVVLPGIGDLNAVTEEALVTGDIVRDLRGERVTEDAG
jgi:hypothetical protein